MVLSAGRWNSELRFVHHGYRNCKDITDRKWAEEALRQAEEKYRALFEDAVVGMYQALPTAFCLL